MIESHTTEQALAEQGLAQDRAVEKRWPAVDRRRGPATSVIVPTFNEADNIAILLDQVVEAFGGARFEIIVVDDDSPDGTWKIVEERAAIDDRIRVIRRVGDRGLSSAVMLGFSVARGDVFVVMDGDLQHDPNLVPTLAAEVLDNDSEICIASRLLETGGFGTFSRNRRSLSRFGALFAKLMLPLHVSDPMSGFFAVSRQRYDQVSDMISPRGFKILLEILARGPIPKVSEVPFVFSERQHGESKLSGSVLFAYLHGVLELSFGRFMSATFSAYLLVGLIGVLVRFIAATALAFAGVDEPRWLAIEASILSNYALNNQFTFGAWSHRGRRIILGLVSFHLVAAHGLLVESGVTDLLLADVGFLGSAVAVLLGIGAALFGNYFLNSTITWRGYRSGRPF